MTQRTIALRASIAAAAALLLTAPAASAADSFFAGKTVTIIAGFRPGGGIDGMARLIARHYGQSIPGKPDILVKNIAGAAGNVAANHIYNKADKDGLTLATPGRTWMLSKLFGDPGVRFDAKKFTYIGSAGPENDILWVRADTGIKTFADLKKSKRTLVFGALSLRSTNGSIPLILGHDGLPIKVLPGYKGTSRIMLAIEQKEVDGMMSGEDTFRANRGDLIDNKVVLPILHSRVVRFLAHPIVAWLLFAAVSWGSHFSPLFDLALENDPHALEAEAEKKPYRSVLRCNNTLNVATEM